MAPPGPAESGQEGDTVELEVGDDARGGSRALTIPPAPTEEMVREHAVSHIPYRSWRSACVRGRGPGLRHREVDHAGDQVPVVSIDFAFLGTSRGDGDDQPKSGTPTLVVRDRWSKSIYAHVLPSKGLEHAYGEKCILTDLQKLGYKRVVMKSDQEPAMIALIRRVQEKAHCEIVPEHSPVGESRSNGEVERAIQTIEGLARTLKDALQTNAQATIAADCQIVPWLVEYSAVLHNLYHKGEPHDGRTPYSRIRGRDWKIALPCFGEVVDYMVRGTSKLEARWREGVFLGVRDHTTEKIIGTVDGVVCAQSLRRRPDGQQFSVEAIDKMRGTPWNWIPPVELDPGDRVVPCPLEVKHPEIRVEPIRQPQPALAKRYYITRSDLQQYGYTAGCPACEGLRTGTRGTKPHTEECRTRIQGVVSSDPMRKERFKAAEQRINEALSKEVERITTGPGGDEDAPPVKKVRFEGDEQFGVSPQSSSQPSSSSAAGPVPMETGSKESRKQPEEPEEDDRAVKEAREDDP